MDWSPGYTVKRKKKQCRAKCRSYATVYFKKGEGGYEDIYIFAYFFLM